MTRVGSENCRYEERHDWLRLPRAGASARSWTWPRTRRTGLRLQPGPPAGHSLRGRRHPNRGLGMFTRPHGLTAGPTAPFGPPMTTATACAAFTWDGELRLSLGTPGQGSAPHSGPPSTAPAEGPSPSAPRRSTSYAGRVYVADRENHRVQIFDRQGGLPRPVERHAPALRPPGLRRPGLHRPAASHLDVNSGYPNIGGCVTIHDLDGNQLGLLGGVHPGEGSGEYSAPHGLAVDSRGDLYVGEVSWSAYGRRVDPPRLAPCFCRLVRV